MSKKLVKELGKEKCEIYPSWRDDGVLAKDGEKLKVRGIVRARRVGDGSGRDFVAFHGHQPWTVQVAVLGWNLKGRLSLELAFVTYLAGFERDTDLSKIVKVTLHSGLDLFHAVHVGCRPTTTTTMDVENSNRSAVRCKSAPCNGPMEVSAARICGGRKRARRGEICGARSDCDTEPGPAKF